MNNAYVSYGSASRESHGYVNERECVREHRQVHATHCEHHHCEALEDARLAGIQKLELVDGVYKGR